MDKAMVSCPWTSGGQLRRRTKGSRRGLGYQNKKSHASTQAHSDLDPDQKGKTALLFSTYMHMPPAIRRRVGTVVPRLTPWQCEVVRGSERPKG